MGRRLVCRRLPHVGALVISEHARLTACLKDLHAQRPIRGKNKPMPSKEGPLWQAFLEWFATADLGRAMRRADVWRAFSAGVEFGQKQR